MKPKAGGVNQGRDKKAVNAQQAIAGGAATRNK